MNGTVRVLAFTFALFGLTAPAIARNDSFNGKNEGHRKENHAVFHGERHEVDFTPHPDMSYGHEKDDHHPATVENHHKRDVRPAHINVEQKKKKHRPHPARDHIEAFQDLWRDTGSFAHSCVKNVWSTVASHWPHHGNGGRDGGFTLASYGGHGHGKPDRSKPDWNKPDRDEDISWEKPDWGKPHNHDWPDKPGWHMPRPDCSEPPVRVPEPGSLPVLAAALLLTGLLLRRRAATS